MTAAHLKELLALLLIGEGVVGALYPEQYTRTWESGSGRWQKFIGWWADRPQLMRALCAAEAGVGLWLAVRQFTPDETQPRAFERNLERVPHAGSERHPEWAMDRAEF
jgi:hypothetical protein